MNRQASPSASAASHLNALRALRQQLRQSVQASGHDAARRPARPVPADTPCGQPPSAPPLSDHALFVHSVGPVQPLRGAARVVLGQPRTLPRALRHQLDAQAVLRESLSDAFDVSTLLDTDDGLSYRRTGIGLDVLRRLRRGDWAVQGELDLHGLRRDAARDALGAFLRRAARDGLRCVRIVHGKGLGSPGRLPVLKARVQSWLVQQRAVLAFVQARPAQGGAGALVVLLQGQRPHN